MEKITGIVKSLRKDKTAVCLTIDNQENGGTADEWFNFGDKVKPEYVIVGSSFEASVIDDEEGGSNRILTFIKCDKKTETRYAGKGGTKPMQDAGEFDESIQRMSALKSASLVYSGTGKENEFKRLTDEVVEYIKKGIWTVRP